MDTLASSSRPGIPPSALILSVCALSVPVSAAFFFPTRLGDYSALLWLLALVPAFLLAYHRGWRGIATSLASGMAVLSATQAITAGFGAAIPDLLIWVVAIYVAVALGVGWLAERMHRDRRTVERLAFTDDVTGLPNRRHATLFLKTEMAAAERGRALAAVVFDLDHFKAFNDRHGHAAGDEALRRFGQLLARQTRRSNVSARLGGEEFLTVLCDGDAAGAVSFAERVRQALAATELSASRLTVSAGVAVYHPDMRAPDDLIAAADSALYRAKGDGRDCVRVFGQSPESAASGTPAAESAAASPAPHASTSAAQGRDGDRRHAVERHHAGGGFARVGSSEPPLGQGRSLLLVEDDEGVRRALGRFLRAEGFQVNEASNAFQAIQKLGAEFDIVLTDVRLPGASGIDLVAAVKSRHPGTPILVFTGLNEAAVAADALNAGADRYVFKPVELDVLRRHLAELMVHYDRTFAREAPCTVSSTKA